MEPTYEVEKGPEDHQEYERHIKYHRPQNYTVFPRTPLSLLLSKERSEKVRINMRKLKIELRNQMSFENVIFFNTMFGSRWEERFYLPRLEFVDSIPEFVQEILPDVQERISILRDATSFGFERGSVFRLGSLPYFLTTEEEALEVYGGVLENGNHFPRNFFRYDRGRKAGIVTRHMYGVLKEMRPEEVSERAMRKDFKEFKLGSMLRTYFEDSTQAAVQNAYPQSRYPELYDQKKERKEGAQNKFGGLSHLVDSIDDLFEDS